jgi:hypothetical protein
MGIGARDPTDSLTEAADVFKARVEVLLNERRNFLLRELFCETLDGKLESIKVIVAYGLI